MARGQARRFARDLAIFLLPIVVALAPPFYVLFSTGEFAALDVEAIARRQAASDTPILFGPTHSDCTKAYKLAGARASHAHVMAIGTSRVMRFREPTFTSRFYNAGNGTSQVDHLRPFLARLPRAHQPEVIVLGLDQNFFNANWRAPERPFEAQVAGCTNELNVFQSSWIGIYKRLARGEISLSALDPPREFVGIGFGAKVNKSGLRNDGSVMLGRVTDAPDDMTTYPDRDTQITLGRIRNNIGRLKHGDAVDDRAVAEVEQFLVDARARGIHVTAFLPPYAPNVVDALAASGKYHYIPMIEPRLRPIFERHGATLFDLTDIRSLDAEQNEFVDGLHAAEVASVRILVHMAAQDAVLRKHVDVDAARAMIARSANPLALASDQWR